LLFGNRTRFVTFGGCALAVILLSRSVHAQFYAPETQWHDVSQRFFPVEAARVLAWLERQSGGVVAEVAYDLRRTGGGINEWQIRWLNADRKEVRAATVRYPDATLTNGPAFYREVFNQLGGRTNPLSGKKITGAALESAFWEGANRAGYSRMECLQAAFDAWKPTKGDLPDPAQVALLAGLLAQTPTHGFWQQSALDALLLARAAAWLCVAESSGTSNDALWSPILFVAEREWQARAIWTPRTNPPVAAWWNVLISGAPANEALVFVAAPEQRSRAMPMMAWQGSISDGYVIAAGNLLEPLLGKPNRDYLRLHDYAPGFADSTVENGHLVNGWWPVLARGAWVRTLKAYPANELDFRGYGEALAEAGRALHEQPSQPEHSFGDGADNSTRQLDSVSPLLRSAYAAAVGPLTPVAHVTARDLLHFGWENAVLQMGARHYFVQTKWGVPELAREILKAATNHIPHFATLTASTTNSADLAEALHRLQFVNWTFGGRWPAAGTRNSEVLTNDLSTLRTHWLRPSMTAWLYNWWFWAHTPQERRSIIAALLEQGGRRMNLKLLNFLTSDSKSLDELRAWGGALTNGLPLATGLTWDYLRRLRVGTSTVVVPTPEACRQAEKLFWSNPNSTLAPTVFQMYLLAGEFPAAKAFYAEAMDLSYDAVSYSMRMESPRWILAMFEGDKQAIRQVLSEHETGSLQDYLVRINDALWRQDYKAAEALVQEGIDRYGAGKPNSPSSLEILRRVLSLRRALADPKDGGHAHALGYLVNVTTLPLTQWILIQNLKLSPADAATFLGGDKAKGVRKLMIHYLQKDKNAFETTLSQMQPPLRSSTCATAGWLRARLLDRQPTLKGVAVRPADAKPIEEIVRIHLQQATP
jgi:hypothetical protein